MDDRRAVVLWSSGVLAAALSVALLVASRLHGSVWHDPWFVLSVAVAAVAFAVLVVSGVPDLAGWLRGRTGKASGAVITSPLTDQIVPQAVWARGSAVNIANGVTLWLVVLAGRSYYPQAKIRLPASGTGTWDQLVHFGRVDGSTGNHYTLYAVGADAAATRAFEDYFRQRAAGQDPGPLTDAAGTYPDVTTFASVHVIRAAPERRSSGASLRCLAATWRSQRPTCGDGVPAPHITQLGSSAAALLMATRSPCAANARRRQQLVRLARAGLRRSAD